MKFASFIACAGLAAAGKNFPASTFHTEPEKLHVMGSR